MNSSSEKLEILSKAKQRSCYSLNAFFYYWIQQIDYNTGIPNKRKKYCVIVEGNIKEDERLMIKENKSMKLNIWYWSSLPDKAEISNIKQTL